MYNFIIKNKIYFTHLFCFVEIISVSKIELKQN